MKPKKMDRYRDTAHYIEDGNVITLYSYNSPIVELTNRELTKVYPHYNYSVTTARHRNYFLQEYFYATYKGTNLNTLNSKQLKNLLQEVYSETNKKLEINYDKLDRIISQTVEFRDSNKTYMVDTNLILKSFPVELEETKTQLYIRPYFNLQFDTDLNQDLDGFKVIDTGDIFFRVLQINALDYATGKTYRLSPDEEAYLRETYCRNAIRDFLNQAIIKLN